MKKLLIIAVAALVLASGAAYAAQTLNAAGATFPYPLYSKWFYEYNQKTGTKINYASIGSGGGIAQVKAGTVDFGCSDAPSRARSRRRRTSSCARWWAAPWRCPTTSPALRRA